MSKRWDQLSKEFGLQAANPAADKKRVLEQVFARLELAPKGSLSLKGGKLFMTKKIKTAIIVLAVLVLSSGTVLAASYFGLLNEVFDGDTSYLEGSVQKPNASVTDGRFTLTVEEYLVSENQALVMYSIKAETPEAWAELTATDEQGRDTFWDMDTLSFQSIDTEKFMVLGYANKHYYAADTADTQYYILTCFDMDNPDGVPVRLRLNAMAKPNNEIILDMTKNIDTKTWQLNDDLTLNISTIGMVTRQHLAEPQPQIVSPEIFFRTTDGDILTNYQIYEYRDGTQNDYEVDGSVTIEVRFIAKTIISPDKLASIIIDGREYSLADGAYLGEPEIPAELQAFIVTVYRGENDYGIPLDEIAAHVGADWQFDAATGKATMTYRDATVELTAGQKTATINGVEENLPDYQEAPQIDENGHFIIYSSQILDLFNITGEMYGEWVENYQTKPVAEIKIVP